MSDKLAEWLLVLRSVPPAAGLLRRVAFADESVRQDKKIMLYSSRKLSHSNLGRPVRSLVFFILFYLYLWLEVDLRLMYHGGGVIANFPPFFRGWEFFHRFTSYPGGLTEYLSAFLVQFFHYSWAGALVVTLQTWLICLCIDVIISAINGARYYWIRFAPPILMLILYNQYVFYFPTIMAFLVSLVFVCLYLRITPRGKILDLIVFIVLSVILYTLAGGAYLHFAVLCAAYELFFRSRRQMVPLYLLSALMIVCVEVIFAFDVPRIDAFTNLLPFYWKILLYESRMITIVYILYLLPLVAVIGFGLFGVFARKSVELHSQAGGPDASIREAEKEVNNDTVSERKLSAGIISWIIESRFLFIIAVFAAYFSHNSDRKAFLAIDYYSHQRDWPKVLAAGRSMPNNYFIIAAVNRALYHTGRLSSDMFSYPQRPDALFLISKEPVKVHWQRFDIYFDVGQMSMAEQSLAESMEMYGERPVILKQLALVNLVKDNIGDARIYLGLLGKTLFDSGWANNYLHLLETDPNLSTDQQIQHLRRLMIEKDHSFSAFNYEDILTGLLDKNRQNKMAFEYLMALHLLTGQLDKFVQNLNRLDDFDYAGIPRLYEEAILLYMTNTKKTVDLRGRRISDQSRERFNGFAQILAGYRSDRQAAMNDLAKNYGDSYLFYYVYKHSGVKSQ